MKYSLKADYSIIVWQATVCWTILGKYRQYEDYLHLSTFGLKGQEKHVLKNTPGTRVGPGSHDFWIKRVCGGSIDIKRFCVH